jgi:hypothetical protein
MERKTAKVGTCALWAMRREATLAGLVSGTVSDRTGGSFANGFVSGFYQNIFNNQGERKKEEQKRAAFQKQLLAKYQVGVETLHDKFSDNNYTPGQFSKDYGAGPMLRLSFVAQLEKLDSSLTLNQIDLIVTHEVLPTILEEVATRNLPGNFMMKLANMLFGTLIAPPDPVYDLSGYGASCSASRGCGLYTPDRFIPANQAMSPMVK